MRGWRFTPPFLISTLDGGEFSVSHSGSLILGDRARGANWTGRYGGLTAGQNVESRSFPLYSMIKISLLNLRFGIDYLHMDPCILPAFYTLQVYCVMTSRVVSVCLSVSVSGA
jgi:hypothetical protein